MPDGRRNPEYRKWYYETHKKQHRKDVEKYQKSPKGKEAVKRARREQYVRDLDKWLENITSEDSSEAESVFDAHGIRRIAPEDYRSENFEYEGDYPEKFKKHNVKKIKRIRKFHSLKVAGRKVL